MVSEHLTMVRGVEDPQYDKKFLANPLIVPASITIETKDGRLYDYYGEYPAGDPENPKYKERPQLFNEDIEEKFCFNLSNRRGNLT